MKHSIINILFFVAHNICAQYYYDPKFIDPNIIDNEVSYWIGKNGIKKLTLTDSTYNNSDDYVGFDITEFLFDKNSSYPKEYKTYHGYTHPKSVSPAIDKKESYMDKFGVWHQNYELNNRKREMQYAYDSEGNLIYYLNEIYYTEPIYHKYLTQSIKYDSQFNITQSIDYFLNVCENCVSWYPFYDTIAYLKADYNYSTNSARINCWIGEVYTPKEGSYIAPSYDDYKKVKNETPEIRSSVYNVSQIIKSNKLHILSDKFDFDYDTTSAKNQELNLSQKKINGDRVVEGYFISLGNKWFKKEFLYEGPLLKKTITYSQRGESRLDIKDPTKLKYKVFSQEDYSKTNRIRYLDKENTSVEIFSKDGNESFVFKVEYWNK